MPAAKTTKKAPPQKGAGQVEVSAKKQKAAKPSSLDAAACVLGESKRPMTTREIIDAMAAKGYSEEPRRQDAKTGTLHSAIAREILKEGGAAEFVWLATLSVEGLRSRPLDVGSTAAVGVDHLCRFGRFPLGT